MQHSLFAMEVCARFEPGGRLHESLRGLLSTQPASATLKQKWQFYSHVAAELVVGLPLVERGCWDYFDDDARARASYAEWASSMVTEEGSRHRPSGGDPYRGDARYMTFTMAFLVVNGSPTDSALHDLCDIPEDRLWHRETFRRILSGLGVLSFASIKSDVAYLVPRDAGWGLTQEDLAQPKFVYLRTLV